MSRIKRPLDGVLLFDKPLELSSNFALQKVRRLFQAEKAGHTGTLDPLASGLLPVCFGEATKFSAGLLDADKTYRATLKLGQTTTTGDAEGEITARRPVEISHAQVTAALGHFLGAIDQLPPMHSALKFQGKPLYEYIRNGETIAREKRRITIHELKLEHFSGDELIFSVRCSKGTYVRTLAEDIGEHLGCGAHLTGLRRTAIAGFDLASAHRFEQLESLSPEARDACLLPVDTLLPDYPIFELTPEQLRLIGQGRALAVDCTLADGRVRLYAAGQFVGVGEHVTLPAPADGTAPPVRLIKPVRLAARVALAAAQPHS